MTENKLQEQMEKKRPKDLRVIIRQATEELGHALPKHMNAERLVRIALTAIRQNPALYECTQESFLGALFTSAQVGIEPVAGRAYLLPFNNSRKKPDGSWHTVKEVQFILGYKGVAELFYRHEKAVQVSWGIVHEGDEFAYRYGTESFLHHVPSRTERGPVQYYYAVAVLQGGGRPFMVMTREDCIDHGKKHSKTYNKKADKFLDSSPWATNEDAMCLKTVWMQLAKLLPLSVELQRALEADETSRDFKPRAFDALDIPSNTNWNTEPEEIPINNDQGQTPPANITDEEKLPS